jgi:hypothetical protein
MGLLTEKDGDRKVRPPTPCVKNCFERGCVTGDNGSGLTPEVQEQIFVPFFTTKAEVGTGIGLWVTRNLIESQCGYMQFRSRRGRNSGTVMSFFLPLAPKSGRRCNGGTFSITASLEVLNPADSFQGLL